MYISLILCRLHLCIGYLIAGGRKDMLLLLFSVDFRSVDVKIYVCQLDVFKPPSSKLDMIHPDTCSPVLYRVSSYPSNWKSTSKQPTNSLVGKARREEDILHVENRNVCPFTIEKTVIKIKIFLPLPSKPFHTSHMLATTLQSGLASKSDR